MAHPSVHRHHDAEEPRPLLRPAPTLYQPVGGGSFPVRLVLGYR